jgi:hypothetical protein
MVGGDARSSPTTIKVSDSSPGHHHRALLVSDDNSEIVIAVRKLEHLFTAPDVDPWSPYEVELTGESGLLLAVRHFESKRLVQPYLMRSFFRLFTWPQYFTGGSLPFDPKRLVLLVPPAVIVESDLVERTGAVLVRYCEHRIADTQLDIKRMRELNLNLMVAGIAVFLLWMFLSLLLASDVVPDNFWTETFSQGFNIVAWIAIWHPYEGAIYDPIPLHNRVRAYRLLKSLQLEIRPQPQD